jgi:hypothetical protein
MEQLIKGLLRLGEYPSYDNKLDIPIIYSGSRENITQTSEDVLSINADILTITFFLSSRYEETFYANKDKYGRFEYTDSLAFKYNFIDIPIIDEYAMLLRQWIERFVPDLKILKRKSRIIPTHDIDNILRFSSFFKNIKTIIGGDIIARKNPLIAFKSVKQCFAASKSRVNDPLILSILKLIEISWSNGLKSVFYFKGLQKGQRDCSYDVFIPEVKYCMDAILNSGMIVGMHGGLDTNNNISRFREQKENLEKVLGEPITANRQHYLMFDVNSSVQIWQDSGILSDSTIGYSNREGFRCGTCHPFFLYDLKYDRKSTILEIPLIVMEATLFDHRKLNIKAAIQKIKTLYERCVAVEGDMVILWHNENVYRDYEVKFKEVYCDFLLKFA